MDANNVRRAAELLTLLDDLAELETALAEDKTFRLQLSGTNGDSEGGTLRGSCIVENYEQMQRVLHHLRRDAQVELTEKLGVKL